jgi:hypothetical protein
VVVESGPHPPHGVGGEVAGRVAGAVVRLVDVVDPCDVPVRPDASGPLDFISHEMPLDQMVAGFDEV